MNITADSTHKKHPHPINDEVMSVLKQYALGTEHSDTNMLNAAFHEHFRVVAMTKDGLRVINKKDYLSLIKAKKIGGNSRELSIQSIAGNENVMQVSLTLTGEKQVFNDQIGLIKEDKTWKILHNTTQVKERE